MLFGGPIAREDDEEVVPVKIVHVYLGLPGHTCPLGLEVAQRPAHGQPVGGAAHLVYPLAPVVRLLVDLAP